MIHGETFSDFLAMAEHLLSAAYKDNAAVVAAATIAGGVLEQHLRALCVKYGSFEKICNITPKEDASKQVWVLSHHFQLSLSECFQFLFRFCLMAF
jgi:hypothetical protein